MDAILKILLVDDSVHDLYAYEKALQKPNRQFFKAESGQEALVVLLNEKDISLILMDVQMPGMSGFDTAQMIKVRDVTREIPILFISGAEMSGKMMNYGLEIGAFDYILKPVDQRLLQNKVDIFLMLYQQKKQLETQAIELKRSNTELSQFAYIASHDLSEPLRSINSFSQLLAKKYQDKLSAEANEYIGFITAAVSKMRGLIDDLLAFSRVTTQGHNFERIDCNKIVEEVRNTLAMKIVKTNARFTIESLPAVMGDKIQLLRLFQNIIENGLKYTTDQSPQITISGSEIKAGKCRFAIQDNGIGIDTEHFNRIFQIFQRLHTNEEYPGTGIGLAICKRIVERHGGRIWVESKPGKGSTFFFTLPVIAEKAGNN